MSLIHIILNLYADDNHPGNGTHSIISGMGNGVNRKETTTQDCWMELRLAKRAILGHAHLVNASIGIISASIYLFVSTHTASPMISKKKAYTMPTL